MDPIIVVHLMVGLAISEQNAIYEKKLYILINEHLYKFDKENLDRVIDETIEKLEKLKFIDNVYKYNL